MNHIAFVSISFQKRRGKQNEERSLLGVGDHSDHPRTSKHRATSSEEVMGNDLESKFSFGSHVTRMLWDYDVSQSKFGKTGINNNMLLLIVHKAIVIVAACHPKKW